MRTYLISMIITDVGNIRMNYVIFISYILEWHDIFSPKTF